MIGKAEEASSGSEEGYRKLFESLNEGFCAIEILLDEEGLPGDCVFKEMNPAFLRQMAGTHDGDPLRELHETGRSRWLELYWQVARTGVPACFEIEARDTGRFYDVRAFRIGGPESRKLGILFNDITDRKSAELERERMLEQLRERSSEIQKINNELELRQEKIAAQSEELQATNEELRRNNSELVSVTRSLDEARYYLESLIGSANAPIIVWDSGFVITRFNQAFERLSGYRACEVLGRQLGLLFPPASKEEALEKIRKTLEGEHWDSVEIPIHYKFGGVRTALWNSANIYDESGILQATIAQGQDITSRKQAESELQEAKAQAELYLDLMGHDISNMHQIMLLQLGLAREILVLNGQIDGSNGRLIEVSIETLEKAARLIDNVRMLQRLKTGDYRFEAVDLGRMIEDLLKLYSNIPGRELAIDYSQQSPCLVRANPILKNAFANLLDNAVKHSQGKLEIGIEIHRVSLESRPFWRVEIEDNGRGIPDQLKAEVFQRLKRGGTMAKGTGLGLYLVRSLVEGFGGRVECQDRVLGSCEQGTRFVVHLPAFEEG